VVIAIITLLATLLAPALRGARAQAYTTACKHNLRQIYTGFLLYADDHQGEIPPRYYKEFIPGRDTQLDYWFARLVHLGYFPRGGGAYRDSSAVGWCPADDIDRRAIEQSNNLNVQTVDGIKYSLRHSSYGMNTSVSSWTGVGAWDSLKKFHQWAHNSSRMIMIADARNNYITYYVQHPVHWPCLPIFRHAGKANVMYVDGHIELHGPDTLPFEPYKGWYNYF
jgi:prepilin-type processing-associated H-X9-DG protein